MDEREHDAGLRPLQLQFVEAYMALGSVPEAAALVGVDRTTGWRWSQTTAVAREISMRTEEQASRGRAAIHARQDAAWAKVDELLSRGDKPIQARMAMWLIELPLKHAADKGKSLADLQLDAFERELFAQSSEEVKVQ
jgi:hypothetical protein